MNSTPFFIAAHDDSGIVYYSLGRNNINELSSLSSIALDKVISVIQEMSNRMLISFADLQSNHKGEITLEFGVSIDTTGNIWLVSAKSTIAFNVTIKWEHEVQQ